MNSWDAFLGKKTRMKSEWQPGIIMKMENQKDIL